MTNINFKNFENPYKVDDNTIFYEGLPHGRKHHMINWLDETIIYRYTFYLGICAIEIYCKDDDTFLTLATTIELLK